MKSSNAWLVLSNSIGFHETWSVEWPKNATVKMKTPGALLPITGENVELILLSFLISFPCLELLNYWFCRFGCFLMHFLRLSGAHFWRVNFP